ncbi:MAG: class I SAM-dependent methyltransferase [Candidatus Staskawiczbacteria bacterium]|nr:class I SAM-dependent methyltransferase [Candidatus Staskawiczbacteria bacterium]
MKEIKCNLCGSEKYELLFNNYDRLLKIDSEKFSVVRCKNCNLVYLNPQPTAEELIEHYPAQYGPYQDNDEIFKYGFLSRELRKIKRFFNKVKERSTLNKKIVDEKSINYLDFGCGGGKQLEDVRKLHPSWKLYGLDNNKIACENAKSKGFEVFCGDFLQINMSDDFFDQVNMSHVIEHLNDPKSVLQKMNKIIKKGGSLVISTPNFDSLAAKLFRKNWWALETPRHLFLFTPATLLQLLKETGFEVGGVSFNKGPKVEIRSLYYLIGKQDTKINPFIWRLFKPITNILSYFGKTSIMTVYAKIN